MAKFQLQVITPTEIVYDDRIDSLVAPGAAGYLGVLARHAPLVSTLGKGTLMVRNGAQESAYQIDGGSLEVRENVATLLVDRLESGRHPNKP